MSFGEISLEHCLSKFLVCFLFLLLLSFQNLKAVVHMLFISETEAHPNLTHQRLQTQQ